MPKTANYKLLITPNNEDEKFLKKKIFILEK